MALRGRFEETSPEDLLQILALGRRTGVLVVLDAGRTVRLTFYEGEIIDAVDGTRRGEEVVFELLARGTGSFSFRAEEVPLDRSVHQSVPALLLMAAQRLDDTKRARELLSKPAARVVATRVTGATQQIGAAERRLLELVDGSRSVGEIVAASQMPASEAYPLLAALAEKGAITVVTADNDRNPILDFKGGRSAPKSGAEHAPAAQTRRPTSEELREIADCVRQLSAQGDEESVRHGLC